MKQIYIDPWMKGGVSRPIAMDNVSVLFCLLDHENIIWNSFFHIIKRKIQSFSSVILTLFWPQNRNIHFENIFILDWITCVYLIFTSVFRRKHHKRTFQIFQYFQTVNCDIKFMAIRFCDLPLLFWELIKDKSLNFCLKNVPQ